MPYQLPPLPYAFNALEPHIDAKTMEIHHDKHHAAYVTNLNKAVEGTEWDNRPIEELVATSKRCPKRFAPRCATTAAVMPTTRCSGPSWAQARAAQPSGKLAEAIDVAIGRLRRLQANLHRRRHGPLRQRLGLAERRQEQEAGRRKHAQPGQPADARQHADPGRRRVGARLLPELSEPPARLRRRVLTT